MAFDLTEAKKYVSSVDLSETPRGILGMDAASETGKVFEQAKSQAQVVGSAVFSFAQGVDAQAREAISDSALLAQLVANKRVQVETDPLGWFAAYFDVLQNVGWAVQDAGWADYTTTSNAAEVHEKIVEIMTTVLGPTPAALAIIKTTVGALKAMSPDSSWITIFSRESQKAKIARFQVGLVETDPASDVLISLIGCLIEAKSSITQVLVFKFRDAKASFKARSGKVSVNRASVNDLGPTIRSKVRAYQADYLSSIRDI